jgi:hypothetical protein
MSFGNEETERRTGIETDNEELRSLLRDAELMLDVNNQFPCSYCHADTYNGIRGIDHKKECIILQIRSVLEEK